MERGYCGYVCCEETPLSLSPNSSSFDVKNYFNLMTRIVILTSEHFPSEHDFPAPNL